MSAATLDTAALVRVLEDVEAERDRQHVKWGEQNHPDGTGPRTVHTFGLAYAESFRDDARRRCDRKHQHGAGTWADILTEEYAEALAESDLDNLRAELVQVAAVAVAWVEAIDRRPES